jgi:hypothetical protein
MTSKIGAARDMISAHGNPLIHVRRQDIVEAGGIITGRVSGVENGKPRIEDGRIWFIFCRLTLPNLYIIIIMG